MDSHLQASLHVGTLISWWFHTDQRSQSRVQALVSSLLLNTAKMSSRSFWSCYQRSSCNTSADLLPPRLSRAIVIRASWASRFPPRGVDALLRQRRQCVVAPTPSPTRGGQRKRKSLKLSACNSGNKIAAPAPAPPDASPPPALFVALPPASSPSLDRQQLAGAGGVPQSGSWVHAAGVGLCSHAVALADRSCPRHFSQL